MVDVTSRQPVADAAIIGLSVDARTDLTIIGKPHPAQLLCPGVKFHVLQFFNQLFVVHFISLLNL